MRKHAAPIIAATLLLLPVLYVGSYLAIVDPAGKYPAIVDEWPGALPHEAYPEHGRRLYREIFWPLEQIDRRVRPQIWASEYDQRIPPHSGYIELFDPNSPRQSVVP